MIACLSAEFSLSRPEKEFTIKGGTLSGPDYRGIRLFVFCFFFGGGSIVVNLQIMLTIPNPCDHVSTEPA